MQDFSLDVYNKSWRKTQANIASTDRYPNGGVPGTRIGGRREEGSTLHHPTGCHPGGVSSDTYPHRLASVTCRPNHTETNASLTCRHGRGPLGGASFAEGRARSPPRPIHDRGSGWEAGPPCLLGAGSKAWGGLPIARLANPSRVELQSNPSGGAPDTCNRAWGGAITTRRPLYSDRLRGLVGYPARKRRTTLHS